MSFRPTGFGSMVQLNYLYQTLSIYEQPLSRKKFERWSHFLVNFQSAIFYISEENCKEKKSEFFYTILLKVACSNDIKQWKFEVSFCKATNWSHCHILIPTNTNCHVRLPWWLSYFRSTTLQASAILSGHFTWWA